MNQSAPEWSKKVIVWLKRQPKWLLAIGVVVFLAICALLLSETQSPAAGSTAAGVDPYLNSTSLALGVFVRLILVVVAIYIGAILLRRWQFGGNRRPERQLSLVETLHLSQRRSVHLVRAGDQVFLIGSTDQTVTLLGQVAGRLPIRCSPLGSTNLLTTSGSLCPSCPKSKVRLLG